MDSDIWQTVKQNNTHPEHTGILTRKETRRVTIITHIQFLCSSVIFFSICILSDPSHAYIRLALSSVLRKTTCGYL